MMKNSIILTAILLLSCQVFSQADTLFIKGKKSSLELTDSLEVRIKTSVHSVKGLLHIVNDSTISVSNDTIQLSQIERITARRKYNRKVAGTVLTSVGAAGAIGTAVGAVAVSNKSYGGFLGGLDALSDKVILTAVGVASVTMTTIGVILLCRNKTYKSSEYTYTIH